MVVRFLVINVILVLVAATTLRAQAKNTTDNAAGQYQIDSWDYFNGTDQPATAGKIRQLHSNGAFKAIRGGVLNAGIASQTYWVHFNITNTSSHVTNLIVDIDNARLNQLELFEAANTGLVSLGKMGDFFPFYRRAIFHKNFLYPVALAPGEKKEYYLFVNQVGHAFILPIKVFDSKKFSSTTFSDYLFDGVTYGLLLFVSVLSLLFFITSRHALYLYYGLYIITAILWFLSYFGLGFQYLWPGHPALNTAITPCMAAMNVLLNVQICQILLRLRKTNPLLNRLANYNKLALSLVALFPFFVNLNQYGYQLNASYLEIFLSLILFSMLLVSSLVVYYAFKGLITAKFYLFASLIKAGSIINLALLELGLTPAFYNMEAFLQIGIFIEIALFTYALATRYTNFRLKTFEKVIEAHEKERSLISKEIHDGVSSSLTGINYGIKNFTRDINNLPADKMSQLNKIFDELDKVQLEARNISHNTMPDYIKNRTISEVVESHVRELQHKIQSNAQGNEVIQISFSFNQQKVNFSEAVKLNLFRIIQEVLINILKHARAANADIVFSFTKREMIIIAEDDGIGFETVDSNKNNGMGLKNLKSRVDLLEGSLIIKSPIHKRELNSMEVGLPQPPAFGTMIKIRIPYRNNLFKSIDYDY